jgi:hypothetical protein
MKTNTSTTDMNQAQRALAAAGIEATEVGRCPDEICSWCRTEHLSLAA